MVASSILPIGGPFAPPFAPGPVVGVSFVPTFTPVPEVVRIPTAPGPVIWIPQATPTETIEITIWPTSTPPTPTPSRIPDYIAQDKQYRQHRAIQAIKQANYQINEIDKELAILDSHIDEIEKIRKRLRQYLRRPFPWTVIKPKPEDNAILEKRIDGKLAEAQQDILAEYLRLKNQQKDLRRDISDVRNDLRLDTGIVLDDAENLFFVNSFLAGDGDGDVGIELDSEWEDDDDVESEVIFEAPDDWTVGNLLQKRGDGSPAESLFVAPEGLHPYGRYPVPKNIEFDNLILGINEPYAQKKPELEGSHNHLNNPSKKYMEKLAKEQAKAIKAAEKAAEKARKQAEKEKKAEEKRLKAERKKAEKERKAEEKRKKKIGPEAYEREQKEKAEKEREEREQAVRDKYDILKKREAEVAPANTLLRVTRRVAVVPTQVPLV